MIENCRDETHICLTKMVTGLLSHPKQQFYPPENNKHFTNENASRIRGSQWGCKNDG